MCTALAMTNSLVVCICACICTLYITASTTNCLVYLSLHHLPPPLLLFLPLQFLQNNKLRANNAASNGNKLKNKQKSKCMATILNNKCAEATPF